MLASHRRSRGPGAMAHTKLLAYLVILYFERQYPNKILLFA